MQIWGGKIQAKESCKNWIWEFLDIAFGRPFSFQDGVSVSVEGEYECGRFCIARYLQSLLDYLFRLASASTHKDHQGSMPIRFLGVRGRALFGFLGSWTFELSALTFFAFLAVAFLAFGAHASLHRLGSRPFSVSCFPSFLARVLLGSRAASIRGTRGMAARPR